MADLKIRRLTKSFDDLHIIKGVDLDIKDQEFVVFVGPSGCGKSTLLRLIAGLEDVSSGEVILNGNNITYEKPARRDLAMVFQSYALYPHMTVRKNMAFGLKLAGIDRSVIDHKVAKAARILELESLLDRKPKALSGGQRQRVAIGRAIVRNPSVFLFDEPLSNLDAALRVQMRLELAKLHHELKATMIYVTHDQVEAMTLADKVVVLNQGRIEQIGSPVELYNYPANLFVAGFIGTPKMSFIRGVVCQNGVDIALTPGGNIAVYKDSGHVLVPGTNVTVGIRPEHISVVRENEAHLRGTLQVAEHLGSDTYCYVRLGEGELITVREPAEFDTACGVNVGIRLDGRHCHIFDEYGQSCRQRKDLAA